MSVYKQEASLEEMKREAIQRLQELHVAEEVCLSFEKQGRVFQSRNAPDEIHLLPVDEAMQEEIQRFQGEYQCLVYHGIVDFLPDIGKTFSLLFVSPESSAWPEERNFLKQAGLVYAYVFSEIEDGISEIAVESSDGGLRRIA